MTWVGDAPVRPDAAIRVYLFAGCHGMSAPRMELSLPR